MYILSVSVKDIFPPGKLAINIVLMKDNSNMVDGWRGGMVMVGVGSLTGNHLIFLNTDSFVGPLFLD